MSFILDALKKADSERHLGELPGLHSQTTPGTGVPVRASLWRRRSTWAKVMLPLIAVLGWMALHFWPLGVVNHAPVQLTRSAAGSTAPQTPALALAPATSLAPPHTGAKPATEIPVPPPLPKPTPAPVAKQLPASAPTVARASTSGAPDNVKKPVVMAARPVDKPVEQPGVASMIAELPPNLQREIPKLSIAGSMYSANPADRMLLIDKRMLHEGDEISPGLVLETVMPKSATMRYKGYAFRVVF